MSVKSPILIFSTTLILVYLVDSQPSSVLFLGVYNSTATRARAYEVCRETGDRLPHLESRLKSAMVNRAIRNMLKEEFPKFSENDFNYWIGLELEYRWEDESVLPGNWTGWHNTSSPSMNCPGSCVTSDVTGLWFQTLCWRKNHVVCEFTSKDENCAFEAYQGEDLRVIHPLLEVYSSTSVELSVEYCGQYCLDYIDGCWECWVWTHIGQTCIIYVSCYPLLPDVSALQSGRPTSTFHFKNCYIGYLNSTPISDEDSFPNENNMSVSKTSIEATTLSGNDITTEEGRFRTGTETVGTTKYKCEPLVEDGSTTIVLATEVTTVTRQTTPVELTSEKERMTNPVPTPCECSSDIRVSVTTPSHPPSDKPPLRSSTTKDSGRSVQNIIQSLNLNVTKTSAYRRRRTSATDDRPSAQSVGYVGIVLLCTFAVVIVCFDLDFAIDRVVNFWSG